MRLDLSHIRQPETSVLRQFEPSGFADQDEDYRVIAPATLAFTVHKDNDRFRLVGTLTTRLELRCSRCLEAFTLPVNAAFDLRYLPEGRPPRIQTTEDGELADEDDVRDHVTTGRRDRSRRVDAGAVLSRAADEAALPPGLQGALPAVRHQPEHRHLPVRDTVGRSRGWLASKR